MNPGDELTVASGSYLLANIVNLDPPRGAGASSPCALNALTHQSWELGRTSHLHRERTGTVEQQHERGHHLHRECRAAIMAWPRSCIVSRWCVSSPARVCPPRRLHVHDWRATGGAGSGFDCAAPIHAPTELLFAKVHAASPSGLASAKKTTRQLWVTMDGRERGPTSCSHTLCE